MSASVGWPKGRHHSEETRILMGASRLGIDPSDYRAQREAGNRWCSGHHAWEPADRFGPHARMRDGIDTRCRDIARERAREYQRQRRAQEAAS